MSRTSQPSTNPVKFAEPRPFSDPEAAVRKLIEIANAAEAVQDARIYIERVNGPFLAAGGSPAPQRHRARDREGLAVAARIRDLRQIHRRRRRAIRLMAATGWKRLFDDPISLPDGSQLVTLKDAADYIMKLPKAEQDLPEWQTAVACLIGAAEGRDFMMHARIGVLRALNRNIERPLTDRKEMNWGRRKLKRDQ